MDSAGTSDGILTPAMQPLPPMPSLLIVLSQLVQMLLLALELKNLSQQRLQLVSPYLHYYILPPYTISTHGAPTNLPTTIALLF